MEARVLKHYLLLHDVSAEGDDGAERWEPQLSLLVTEKGLLRVISTETESLSNMFASVFGGT